MSQELRHTTQTNCIMFIALMCDQGIAIMRLTIAETIRLAGYASALLMYFDVDHFVSTFACNQWIGPLRSSDGCGCGTRGNGTEAGRGLPAVEELFLFSTVENLGCGFPQGRAYQETKRTVTGVFFSNQRLVDLLVNLPIVRPLWKLSNRLLAPPTWPIFKRRVQLLRSFIAQTRYILDHSMERIISYVNDDTKRRVETLRRQLYRDRYCSPCQLRLTTSKEFKEHSWQHFVLVVCNCGATDSRVRFIKLHQKKSSHQQHHLYKVDHISWGHLRTIIPSLPSQMPQLPKITRINEILQAARDAEKSNQKRSTSVKGRKSPSPAELPMDEDPDFIDLTKPIEESTIVDLTGGASSTTADNDSQYILDLHAEDEYEELLR